MNKPEQVLPGKIIFTTDGMSPEDAFAHWRELNCESTVPNRIEPIGTGNFAAHGWLRRIGELDLVSNACRQNFAVHVEHGKPEIARSQDKLCLLVQGTCKLSLIEYDHRDETLMFPGDWTLMNPSDVFSVHTEHSMGKLHFLMLPVQLGDELRPPSGSPYGRRMASHHTLNQLVVNYIQTLSEGGSIGDAASGETVARNLKELITLALHTTPETREACDNGLASGLLLAITQYLDAHYTEAELSPARVAAQFGITPRYVHRLSERTGTTFSEQVFQRRLCHAHRVLTDQFNRHLSITDIAYDCGFQNLTHFGRRYREMYGETPSDTRARSNK